jgi:hypothetical protein
VPPGAFTAVNTRGNDFACAIRTDHTGVCWGNNALGQGAVPTGSYMSIAGGDGTACGVQTDGKLLCWGSSGAGVPTVPSGAYNMVSDSGDYACAIRTDQGLLCWGSTSNGIQPTPAGTFTTVNAGTFFPCAIRTDKTLTCWGTYAPALPAGSGASPPANTAPQAITAAKAFSLPSAKGCLSRRSFTIRIRKLKGVTWVSAVVKVRGKRVKTVKRSRITAPVNLTGLPRGQFSVSITAKTLDGRTVTGSRTYHTCTRKRGSSVPKL